MYKLIYFVPTAHKEETKEALFAIGVGQYPMYENVCFETLGTGQFRPTADAKPFIGAPDVVEKVEEYRVEMVCKDDLIKKAVEVLKNTHPYEVVAYDVVKLEDI
ncbi:MAG: NGG1p interacting factor NIF3 [Arcobacteraceae bacterium]